MANPMFDTEGLDEDFADEFAAALGGAGEAISNAIDRERFERAAAGVEDDDEDEDGHSLLSAVMEETEDAERAPPAAPAPSVRRAYDENDAKALDEMFKTPERRELSPEIKAIQERADRLERELASLRQPAQQAQQAAPAQGKVRPTGNPDVDEALAEAGVLDTSPQMPPEFETRLQQLERREQELAHRQSISQRAAQIAADARTRAKAVTKVFRDVDEDAVAQIIVAGGDPVEFARKVYAKAGALGSDQMPSRHLSDGARKPMPHAAGVQNSRFARSSRAETSLGWSPTDDPAEREKRLANRR